MEEWEAILEFRVHGNVVGGDGLAFWFVEEVSEGGPVFGARDRWNGLGIFFDSFDNDDKRNNPHVSIINSNGHVIYDKGRDGEGQEQGSCSYNYRNSPETVVMRAQYLRGYLSLWMGYKSEDPEHFYKCAINVHIGDLPKRGYFGISAETGGVSDNHDIYSLNVYDLNPDHSPEQIISSTAPVREMHADDPYTEQYKKQMFESLRELMEKKDREKVERPPTHQPLENEYRELMQGLKGMEGMKAEEKKQNFDFHYENPNPAPNQHGMLSEQSLQYFVYVIQTLENQQRKMAEAFDTILDSLDEERDLVTNQHNTFAESIKGIFENIATSEELESLMSHGRQVQQIESKLEAMTRVVDAIAEQVRPKGFGEQKEHSVLNLKMEVLKAKQMKDQHRNSISSQVKSLEDMVAASSNALKKSTSSPWLFYIVLLQTVGFVIFVVYKSFLQKKKRY